MRTCREFALTEKRRRQKSDTRISHELISKSYMDSLKSRVEELEFWVQISSAFQEVLTEIIWWLHLGVHHTDKEDASAV